METERRKQTSLRQLELMVNYLDGQRALALGRVRSKEARAISARLWRDFAVKLNAEGPSRTSKEWAKVWNDFKCRVRAKVLGIKASHKNGRSSHAPTLTPLEEKVAYIIGKDVDPLEGSGHQDQSISNGGGGGDSMEEERVESEIEESQEIEIFAELPYEQIDQKPDVANLPLPEPDDQSLATSPTASTREQSPPLLTNTRNSADRVKRGRDWHTRRRIVRVPRTRKASTQPAETTQSAQSALEESRLMMFRIEKLRAEAALKTAEAALQNAQSAHKNADSFRLIAQSIDRCSQMFFQQQNHRN